MPACRINIAAEQRCPFFFLVEFQYYVFLL
jgi:hypothetical protein